MATDSDIESVTCQLCATLYTDPSMLPCLHSFCTKCLLKLVAEERDTITCPSCNELTSMPQDGVFPTNVCLARQVQEQQLKIKLTKPPQCEGCVTSVASVAYCSQCSEFLCTMCRDYHKISRKTKDHKVIDVKERKESVSLTKTDQQLICPIPYHGDLRFYCEDCRVLICSDCIVHGSHKNHKYTDYDKVSDTCLTGIQNGVHQCTEAVTTLVDAIQSADDLVQQIQARRKQVDREINNTFDALQAALADRRKALLKESNNIAIAKVTAVNIQLETFHKLKHRLSSATKFVTDTLQSHQSSELLGMWKTIEDRLDKLKREFEELSQDLIEDNTIIASLDGKLHDEISQFGKVSDISHSLSSIESGVAVPLATVGKKRKFTVSVQDMLGDPVEGKVAIRASLDGCGGNRKKIKVMVSTEDQCTLTCTPDTVGEYELSVKVRGTHISNSPYRMWARQERDLRNLPQQLVYDVEGGSDVYVGGVAVHSNGEVFVSVIDGGGYVQVFNRDGTKKRRIGTQGSGDGQFNRQWGLAVVGDILYVVDMHNHRVQKFTINGEYLGQFGSQGSNNGQFQRPIAIAYDGRDSIVVAEYGGKRIQVFKLDGTFTKVFQCGDTIFDIAVDNNGNIHVPLWDSHEVQVFSSDGIKLYNYSNVNGYFNNPGGIAIDENGYRYIAASGHLHILDHTGNQVNVIGGLGQVCGGITLDKDGYVYIVDNINHKIIKY